MSQIGFATSARRTIKMESEAVAALEERIGADFERACELLLQTRGRVIVTGMLMKNGTSPLQSRMGPNGPAAHSRSPTSVESMRTVSVANQMMS